MDGSLFMSNCNVGCDTQVGFLNHKTRENQHASLLLKAKQGKGAFHFSGVEYPLNSHGGERARMRFLQGVPVPRHPRHAS